MGANITTDEKGVRIFRHDKTSSNGKPYTTYAFGVSSKDKDGNWVQGYIDCRFKKGVEVNNKALIEIKNAFPTVTAYNGKTYVSWMITDFAIMENGDGAVAKPQAQAPVQNGGGFMNIPDGIDEELPFQ